MVFSSFDACSQKALFYHPNLGPALGPNVRDRPWMLHKDTLDVDICKRNQFQAHGVENNNFSS
jgi:hypothetical protein